MFFLPKDFGFVRRPIGLSLVAIALLGLSVILLPPFGQLLPSPPKVNPGSCLLVEEKYCSLGKLIDWQDPEGRVFKLVGFRLPEGAPIFTPFAGSVSADTVGAGFNPDAATVTVYNPSDASAPLFTINGVLVFPEKKFTVKEGELLALVGKKNITLLGDYNVVIIFSQFDSERKVFFTPQELLKKHFPYLIK